MKFFKISKKILQKFLRFRNFDFFDFWAIFGSVFEIFQKI